MPFLSGQVMFLQVFFFPEIMSRARKKILNDSYYTLFHKSRDDWPSNWVDKEEFPFIRFLGKIDIEKNVYESVLRDPTLVPGEKIVPFTVDVRPDGEVIESPRVTQVLRYQSINYHKPILKLHLFNLGCFVSIVSIPFDIPIGMQVDDFVRSISYWNWEPQKPGLREADQHKLLFGASREVVYENGKPTTTKKTPLCLTALLERLSKNISESLVVKKRKNDVKSCASKIYPIFIFRGSFDHSKQPPGHNVSKEEFARAMVAIHELVPACDSLRDDSIAAYDRSYGTLLCDYALPTDRLCIISDDSRRIRSSQYVWNLVQSLEIAFLLKELNRTMCIVMMDEVSNLETRRLDAKTRLKRFREISGGDAVLSNNLAQLLSLELLIKDLYVDWFGICKEAFRLDQFIKNLVDLRDAYVSLGLTYKSPSFTVVDKISDIGLKFIP